MNRREALSSLAASAAGLLTATPASAGTLQLRVPTAAPGPTLQPVAGPLTWAPMDLAARWDGPALQTWAPHHDGGYVPATNTFNGYDWWTKRTLAGNGEEQLYVDPGFRGLGLSPFSAKAGALEITARRTPAALVSSLEGYKITSGMLSSRELHVQRYGFFESSIQVPKGQALWPAFWLLPASKAWPPEIDIMEFRGHLPNELALAVHWNDPGHVASSLKVPAADLSLGFRRYGVLWRPDRIVWYLDRQPIAQIARAVAMPMHMLLNLAVGGSFVGATTPSTPLPATMRVRYAAAFTTPEATVFNPQQTFL